MTGEGFKVAMTLVIGFILLSILSVALVAVGRISAEALKELFISLGVLAGLLGVPSIIQAWIQTRGKTGEIK